MVERYHLLYEDLEMVKVGLQMTWLVVVRSNSISDQHFHLASLGLDNIDLDEMYSLFVPLLAFFQFALNCAHASNNIYTSQSVLNDVTEKITKLSQLNDEFTHLSHPRFPGHSVRIKQVEFCDPTVRHVNLVSVLECLYLLYVECSQDI